MRYRNCDLCESNDSTLLFIQNKCSIVKCNKYGLVYVGDELKNLEKLYAEGYYSGEKKKVEEVYRNYMKDSKASCDDYSLNIREYYQNYTGEKERRMKYFKEKLINLIKPYKKGGKVLDVGCAAGFFLAVSRDNGYETFGVEISDYASNYAREELGLEVFTGELINAKFPDKYFDVITMWDVIEHMGSPSANLAEANRILKDDGIIVINTADIDSLNAKRANENWIAFGAPWHLYYFSRITLEKNGFKSFKVSHSRCEFDFPMFRKIIGYKYVKFFFNSIFNIGGGYSLNNQLNIGDVMMVHAKKIK